MPEFKAVNLHPKKRSFIHNCTNRSLGKQPEPNENAYFHRDLLGPRDIRKQHFLDMGARYKYTKGKSRCPSDFEKIC